MAKVFKGTGTKVAKLPGIQPSLDGAARDVLNRAKALASRRRDTGMYMRSLFAVPTRGEKGVIDRLVIAGDPAALPIEFGALVGEEDPKFIPGQFIMTRAGSGK